MITQTRTNDIEDTTAESLEYADSADESNGSSEERIEPDKIHEWAEKLDVTAEQLRVAIQRVGPRADRVLRFLGNPDVI